MIFNEAKFAMIRIISKDKVFILCTTLCFLAVPPIVAQNNRVCDANHPCGNTRFTSFAEALRERGIDTSQSSLITALSNNDPEVRALAAYQLAENRDLFAFPAIENALSTEKNTHARIGIASALASAGDRVGARDMEAMCTHASVSVDDTVRVVQQLATAQRSHPNIASTGKCADVVLAALESVSESYQKRELVSILPSMVHNVPKDKVDRMVTGAQNLLGDKESATRMSASQALAEMGSTASIDVLRKVIQNEPDANIRAWHQRNLDKLTKLQQP